MKLTICYRRSCDRCGSIQCLPRTGPSAPTSSPGVSAGAVAGAVVASVLAFAVAVALYLWFRRRWQRRTYSTTIADEKQEVPARAEDVLKRPDPNARIGSPDMPTFRVDPDGASSIPPDVNSSSYAATHGHSRVPRESQYPAFSGVGSDHRLSAGTHPNLISATFNQGAPSLAGIDAVQDTQPEHPPLPQGPLTSPLPNRSQYPQPADRDRFDVRNSYNTDTTYSSDLSSIPIVEATHGAVRQVLGVARAEVIRTPKPSLSSVHPSLHFNRLSGTKSTIGATSQQPPPVPTSPLATGFFRPKVPKLPQEHEDPFRDISTPSPSGAGSMATFGDSGEQRWPPLRTSRLPWARKRDDSRPNSDATEPASAPSSRSSFGIRWSKSATAAAQTLAPPHSTDVPYTPASCNPSETPRSVTFPSSSKRDTLTVPGVLEQQQRQAINGMGAASASRVSVVSTAPSLSESILSAFPFVPPSPLGSLRTPPRSPLVQQAFIGGDAADRRNSNTTGSSAPTSTLAADTSLLRTASATPSSLSSSTPPPSSASTRHSSITADSAKPPLFLNRKVDRSRLSIDRDART